VPITIAETPTRATTDTYAGYGDPTGDTGDLRPPDATITTNTPGSGASRFELVSDSATSEMYRLRVRVTPELDAVAPAELAGMEATDVTSSSATLAFTASGDDGMMGNLAGYEIRMRVGSPITEENFATSSPVQASFTVAQAGAMQTIALSGLLPETDYYVAVRPYDNCYNSGPLAVTTFTTQLREGTEVPWCFVATAAYGSVMANDVEMLRRFRDAFLTRTVIGELAVETYYTFGPAVAGVVGESDLLRATARGFLAPIVATVRQLAY
jgi:hypothetical protein